MDRLLTSGDPAASNHGSAHPASGSASTCLFQACIRENWLISWPTSPSGKQVLHANAQERSAEDLLSASAAAPTRMQNTCLSAGVNAQPGLDHGSLLLLYICVGCVQTVKPTCWLRNAGWLTMANVWWRASSRDLRHPPTFAPAA